MVTEINENEFDEKVKGKSIVDFFATWCPPCKMLSPVLEELSNEIDSINFYKINVDENLTVSEKYGISHVPTLILFDNREVVNRVSRIFRKRTT